MNDLQRTMRAERAVAYLLGRLGLTAYDAGTNHDGEPLYYSDLLAHDIAAVQSADADWDTMTRLGLTAGQDYGTPGAGPAEWPGPTNISTYQKGNRDDQ